MSEFSCLCADATMWDPTTRAAWGSLNFCPVLMWFQVHAITWTQLTALSQVGAWGEVKKPRWDMAFLMIVPSTNARGDQVFSLPAVWAHPCQGHLSTLAEAAQSLMLLANDSPDWLYAFICMSDTMLHIPLSDNEHISTMTDGICSIYAYGWLYQLQVWKLLQHSDSIVFPEGLNGEPEALQFSFWELPLWNAASSDGTAQHPPMLQVVLSGIESEITSLTQVPPPSGHWTSTWHCHHPQPTPPGGLGMGTADIFCNLSSLFQHSIPGRKLPFLALGALPSNLAEDQLSSEGLESAIPDPMATSSQVSQVRLHWSMPPTLSRSVTHSPHLPYQKLWMWPASPPVHRLRPPQGWCNLPVWWGASTAKGDEHGLGAAAHH